MHQSIESEALQGTLLPPEAVELVLRVGVIGASDHGQWQLEVRCASDGTLLAMVSRPHFTIEQWHQELAKMSLELTNAWSTHVLPF